MAGIEVKEDFRSCPFCGNNDQSKFSRGLPMPANRPGPGGGWEEK